MIFTNEEEIILKETLRKRIEMSDDLFEDGSPIDNRDRRMSLELLNSIDDSLIRTGKLRQDEKKNTDDNEMKSAVLAALTSARTKATARVSEPVIPDELDNEELIGEILESELSLVPIPLIPSEFIQSDDDE